MLKKTLQTFLRNAARNVKYFFKSGPRAKKSLATPVILRENVYENHFSVIKI